ncbi:nitroreductase/quinone reductase family protein [Saccharothrix sp. ALI-22-I]|uniref:nitroreductase/quinone reductase family protein n=1 Tax=Saccharothrix sp. ALI-22-I TaxID=1933778 RepID=UPI003082803D
MTDQILDFNQKIIAEFRANGGVVGGMFEGRNILLLTTVGAKSGGRPVRPVPARARGRPGDPGAGGEAAVVR